MGKNIELEQLVINKLTQEQYDALAVKNPGELYFITDANPTKEVETQLAELSEKVPEPISTYESFPEATAENVGMRVVYTGETIEAPYIENEDGSVSTVFLDPYLTRGHTFMLVPVQVLTSDTESITIYMWQDVIGAIPPFDYDMAGQVLSTNGMGYEWTELPEAGLTKEEADQTYLPLSGGTLTGPLQMKLVGGNGACIVINRQGNDSLPSYNWTIESSAATCALSLKSNYGTPCVFYNSFINPGSPSSTIGSTTQKWSRIYAKTLNNDADLTIPTEGGTIARLEDIPESTQVETIPEVSVDNVGKVLQYIGQTNETYTNGYFYKCLIDASNAFQLNTDNMWLPEHTISIVNANQLRKAIPNEYLAKENSILFYYDIFDGVSAWSCDLGSDGFFGPLTDDEMLNNYGISIVKTGDTDAQPGDYFSITYIAENETNGWQQIDVQPEADALPDQTDNAGKFLQTNGTEVSWGNALANNSSNTGVAIGVDTTANSVHATAVGSYAKAGMVQSTAIGFQAKADVDGQGGSVAIGQTSVAKNYSVSLGSNCSATGFRSVAIGNQAIATADAAVMINLTTTAGTNNNPNTVRIRNQNGDFEIMSADGTIPTDRYSITPTGAGTYVPKLTIAEDGTATREWGSESGGAGGEYLPLSGGTLTGTLQTQENIVQNNKSLSFPSGNSLNATFGMSISKIGVASLGVGNFGAYKGTLLTTVEGHYYPNTDGTHDFGQDNAKWRAVYATKLNNGTDIAVPTTGGTMVVATPPTDNGTYVLKATVVDGVVTTEWVLES